MYKVRTTNSYIFMNSIRENKNPQFENFSKNELIEMLNILSDEYRDCYQRIEKTIEFITRTQYDEELRSHVYGLTFVGTEKVRAILKGEKDETN